MRQTRALIVLAGLHARPSSEGWFNKLKFNPDDFPNATGYGFDFQIPQGPSH
jgi:hypothetical protein